MVQNEHIECDIKYKINNILTEQIHFYTKPFQREDWNRNSAQELIQFVDTSITPQKQILIMKNVPQLQKY